MLSTKRMTEMSKAKAIILLSGGLDSIVSLAAAQKNYDVRLALTFDYGQKAFEKEVTAAKKIAEYYALEHKIIELDWLKKINKANSPELSENDLKNDATMAESAKHAWVPNRNAVLINIAAAFADTVDSDYKYIIIGANLEEAQTFTDNSADFISAINNSLHFSTNSKVQVVAPFMEKNKAEIMQFAVSNEVPVEYLYSCYAGSEAHCGKCESCLRLKRAISTLSTDLKTKLLKYFF